MVPDSIILEGGVKMFDYLTRPELLPDRHDLPSRFWEPEPEEVEIPDFDPECKDDFPELPFI